MDNAHTDICYFFDTFFFPHGILLESVKIQRRMRGGLCNFAVSDTVSIGNNSFHVKMVTDNALEIMILCVNGILAIICVHRSPQV